MKKIVDRFYNIFLILIICLGVLISGCGESDTTDTTDGEENTQEETEEKEENEETEETEEVVNVLTSSTKNVLLYFTCDMNEYFKYLNDFDSSAYEILNIETSEHISDSIEEYYMITYRKVNAPKAKPKGNMYRIYTSNEYFVFTTQSPIEYLDFIDELDFEKYKILGFSKSGNKLKNGSYMITYIEI